ncbi:hypothetical protein V6N13_005833 [Hibiscus sabdariffa]|uniref:Uncharacterized protein n=1 Tax=Hibiscus sabdariffa TaxID=183260 RepID=A0ABR2EPK5_9ROSI
MEDVVPEAVLTRGDDEVAEEGRQNPEAANAGTGTGFITHLFSNFVNGGTVGDGENPTEQAEKETTSAGAEEKNEEKGGGLFDHIISNLVSPRSGGKVEAFDDTSTTASQNKAEEEGGGGGGGGGLINNLMSNLFHHSESEGEVGEESKNKKQKVEVEVGEDESKAEKTEEGGGIIENIVSQLPTSLPDSAAPSSDEATILIHIVQD